MNIDTLDNLEPAWTCLPLSIDTSKKARRSSNRRHQPTRMVPVEFQPDRSAVLAQESAKETRSTHAQPYEALLHETVAPYASLPAVEREQQTTIVLRRICESFGLDCAGLWRNSIECSGSFELVAHWSNGRSPLFRQSPQEDRESTSEGSPHSRKIQSLACCPWLTGETRKRTSTVFSSTAAFPAEAAQDKLALEATGLRSGVIVPLVVSNEVWGALAFGSAGELPWPELLVKRLEYVAGALAQSIGANEKLTGAEAEVKSLNEQLARAQAEIRQLKTRLRAEADHLEAEFTVAHSHGESIGRSQGIRRVLHQSELVASAGCPVLISGETGTGKELIAQQIHRLSARKERRMVLVNCAALPSALVESELFGRERGAYTGALTSQVGRFETADGSTIFLDEVGELSVEVQAKLLRVLQEGEFQRLGSPKTHKVDVRVIAATNRDLADDVRKGRFREDLYYRLRVFPIEIPPLRERLEDIPLLVFAFMEEFANRMGKKITRISAKAMEKLQAHPWSGNIRELRNVIEHSVILTSGDTLNVTVCGETPTRELEPVTLAEVERQHILKTLESTNWRIKGPHGAAQRLDVQPSTLYSRMQKLAIPHRRQKDQMSRML